MANYGLLHLATIPVSEYSGEESQEVS